MPNKASFLLRLPALPLLSAPINQGVGWLYRATDRKPWTRWYKLHRHYLIQRLLQNQPMLNKFRQNQPLPPNYAPRLDERLIEYPWVYARLRDQNGALLDAGSVLNRAYLLAHPKVAAKNVIIYTLAPERWFFPAPNISYLYGDLRSTVFADNTFDEIVCLSTLEHIGLDNTLIYTSEQQYQETQTEDYVRVLHELRRVLKPGGQIFITVPYGRYQNISWMQQFDRTRLGNLVAAFDNQVVDQAFYKYSADGWQIADQTACDDCEYFDIHSRQDFDPDFAAAARAVACLQLTK